MNKRILPVLYLLTAAGCLFFLVLCGRSGNETSQIDLIRLFSEAEKTNIGPGKDLDRSIVINKPLGLLRFIKNDIGKMFTKFDFLYKSGAIQSGEVKNVGNGGIALILSASTTARMKYEIKFRYQNETVYNGFVIERDPKNVKISHRINREEFNGEYPVSQFDPGGQDQRLYLVFADNAIFLFTDSHLLYLFKDETMPHRGSVKLKIEELSTGKTTDDRIRFSGMDESLKKDFLYYSELSDIQRWSRTLNTEWNDLRPENLLVIDGETDLHLQRIRLGNITRPAILLPAAAVISYDVVLPKKPRLDFSAAVMPLRVHEEEPVRFRVALDFGGDERKTIEFKYTFDRDWEYAWRNSSIDLAKYEGRRCSISFSMETSKVNKDIIIAWGAPVINSCSKPEDLNLLLISLDTLRADHLGCYGYFRDTSPIMDSYAAKGTVFLNTIAPSPWTLPSHSSILTGLYPMETGNVPEFKDDRKMKKSRVAPEMTTLAEYMKSAGYNTCAVTGSGFMASYYGFDQGFDTFLENISTSTERDIAREAPIVIDWIRKNKNTKFFMFFHTFEIHHIYLRRHFKPDPPYTVADEVIANYDSGILYSDRYVGEIIKALEEEGILDKTLVIITSDHGENFDFIDPANNILWGKHGRTMKDCEMKVPLIIFGPPDFNRSLRISKQVRSVDIVPTVLDYFDIDPATGLRGGSLLPLIKGDREDTTRVAYSEGLHIWSNPAFDERAIRTSERKLIKSIPMNQVYKGPEANLYTLYDLKKDPHEKINVFKSAGDQAVNLIRLLDKTWESIYRNSRKFKKRELKQRNPYDHLKQLIDLGYINPRN